MFRLIHRAIARVIPARYRPHMFIANRLLARSGGRVMTGPFRGLSMVVDPTVMDWPAIYR